MSKEGKTPQEEATDLYHKVVEEVQARFGLSWESAMEWIETPGTSIGQFRDYLHERMDAARLLNVWRKMHG